MSWEPLPDRDRTPTIRSLHRDATLLSFLEATYASGARLAGWDRSDEMAPVRG